MNWLKRKVGPSSRPHLQSMAFPWSVWRRSGIHFASDLLAFPHYKELCKKSRKLVGLLHRNFATHSPPILLCWNYIFIRPNLEYVSIVGNPHLKCNIEGMEKVQKFTIKVCLKQWDNSISYLDILKQAKLPTLGQRRTYLYLEAIICLFPRIQLWIREHYFLKNQNVVLLVLRG